MSACGGACPSGRDRNGWLTQSMEDMGVYGTIYDGDRLAYIDTGRDGLCQTYQRATALIKRHLGTCHIPQDQWKDGYKPRDGTPYRQQIRNVAI